MARIILTIAGPWDKPPAFDTPFILTPGPPDPTLVDDFQALAVETEGVDVDQISALTKHRCTIVADGAFEGPGSPTWARHAAQLMADAFTAGALGIRVETGLKVFAPGITEGLELRDPKVLLHLLVEVLMDEDAVTTEGMQAFDLPDVRVAYDEATVEPAQAAAFAMAARMACDRFKPADGGVFRASESAPLFDVKRHEPAPDAEPSPFDNPRGHWLLTVRKG